MSNKNFKRCYDKDIKGALITNGCSHDLALEIVRKYII